MKKYVYVIKDELSGELVNTFIANNDEVAKIVVERSLEKIPMYGDISLYSVAFIQVLESGINSLSGTGSCFLVKRYYKKNENKSKRK